MNRLTKGLLAGAVALALAASAGPSAEAYQDAPNRDRYAALGDSFAAGVGNPALKHAGESLRSGEAYPVLLAGRANKVTFLAESGATVESVLQEQVSQVPTSAQQVTLTVGGNDLGFTSVMFACAGGFATAACQAAVQAAGVAAGELPGELATLLAALRAQAPGATIFVTGYPVLFQPAADGSCLTLDLAGFAYDPVALGFADAAAMSLNQVLENTVLGVAAATVDPNLVFVDVADEFDGHGLCDPADSYIYPPSLVPGTGIPAPSSLHPNAAGQMAYADAIALDGFVTYALN